MTSARTLSTIVGVLIVVAYSMLGSSKFETKIISLLLELVSGASVITIAFIMSAFFSLKHKKLSFLYLFTKIIEGGLLVFSAIFVLSSHPLLVSVRELITQYHAFFFIPGAGIFYYLLLKQKMLPRFLAIWGMNAVFLLLLVNLLEMLSINIPYMKVLYMPIIVNEIVLAFWLIGKGFDKEFLKVNNI